MDLLLHTLRGSGSDLRPAAFSGNPCCCAVPEVFSALLGLLRFLPSAPAFPHESGGSPVSVKPSPLPPYGAAVLPLPALLFALRPVAVLPLQIRQCYSLQPRPAVAVLPAEEPPAPPAEQALQYPAADRCHLPALLLHELSEFSFDLLLQSIDIFLLFQAFPYLCTADIRSGYPYNPAQIHCL